MADNAIAQASATSAPEGERVPLSVTLTRLLRVTDAGAGVSLTAMAAAIGTPADAAWDGVAASATVISLLKAIAINTTPEA